MKKTILLTAVFCLTAFAGIISCNKNNGNNNQNNDPNNPNNPVEPFTGCNMTDGTNPASFTIDGIDYVANGIVNSMIEHSGQLSTIINWSGAGGGITIHLKVYANDYKGVGKYTYGKGAIAEVLIENLPNSGLYVSHHPVKTPVNICIEEVDTDEVKIKGYFSAEVQTINEDLTEGPIIKITNGYFRVRK